MSFVVIKSLHIIFMVSLGLLVCFTLFDYLSTHTEAQQRENAARQVLTEQFIIMEKKLWWIITTPAMVLTLLFGIWMLLEVPCISSNALDAH